MKGPATNNICLIPGFFFYKKHFYEQHKAEIGLFWNTNIGKFLAL